MAEAGGAERLVEFADALVDDPARITKYRVIGMVLVKRSSRRHEPARGVVFS